MKKIALIIILAVGLISGCTLKNKAYSPSEAEKKLVEFCQKEGSIKIVTRLVNKTLWIYIPFNESLFTVKPSTGERAEKKKSPYGLLYLGGQFDGEKNFALNYDIVPDVLPPDPQTYGSAYNENYTKKRQLIYQGMQETIFNATPADSIEFIVLVVADVQTGVATKSTIYLKDLKQYMTEALPPDEYYMRENNEVFGDKKLIGDNSGEYVDYAEIEWPAFLIEQMKTRVKFKFTQSSFPPETNPDDTIAAMAANTLRIYPFSDYKGLYLYNIRAKKDVVYDKPKLKTMEEKSWWEDKGRFTTIHFDAGAMRMPAKKE